MPIHEVVDVVAVRHWFMPASRAVYVMGIVSLAGMAGRATGGIGVADFHNVFFNLTVRADVVQVTIVQVVHMVAVLNSGMFAARSVLVVVIGVQIGHVIVPHLWVDFSIACMTPLVTNREMCSSASA